MLDPNDSGQMAVCLGKPISKWAGESLNLNLREMGSDGRFGRELHHPVPVLKKIPLSTLEGDRPVVKQAVEVVVRALWGSMGWSSCWGCVKIQLESVTDWLWGEPVRTAEDKGWILVWGLGSITEPGNLGAAGFGVGGRDELLEPLPWGACRTPRCRHCQPALRPGEVWWGKRSWSQHSVAMHHFLFLLSEWT